MFLFLAALALPPVFCLAQAGDYVLLSNMEIVAVTADSYSTDKEPSRACDWEYPRGAVYSEWKTTEALPNWICFDLGTSRNVARIEVYWRTTGPSGGIIDNYTIFVTDDPGDWGVAVSSGAWAYTANVWQTNTPACVSRGRYVVIRADTRHYATTTGLFDIKIYTTPFVVTDQQTGSREFTNSNKVDVTSFWAPTGYDRYQITETASSPSGAWVNTNSPPSTLTFTQPSGNSNVTLYAWFTNASVSVGLTNITTDIIYTEATPSASILSSLTVAAAPGTSVRIQDQINDGSTGGTASGRTIDVYRAIAKYVSGPGSDATPSEPFVTLTDIGTHNISLTIMNEAGNTNIAVGTCAVTVSNAAWAPAGDRYVSAHNINAAAPYSTWATAASNIQDAVDAAAALETILVWPGVYDGGGQPHAGGVTNRVDIDKALTLKAVSSDPADTVIEGAKDPDNPEAGTGDAAIRGVYMVSGSSLMGFTVTNGYTLGLNNDGGGIRMEAATVSNCVITGNGAIRYGGGIYMPAAGALVVDCTMTHNIAFSYGGGIYGPSGGGSVVSNCSIVYNIANYGGGGQYGDYWNCDISHNNAGPGYNGAGGRYGSYYNCTIISNMTYASPLYSGQCDGGGLSTITLARDCTIIGNESRCGSGGFNGYYDHCTFMYNKNTQNNYGAVGSGYTGGTTYLTNCLIVNNLGVSGSAGAGIHRVSAWNCTIYGNRYGLRDCSAAPRGLVNCIVYSNTLANFYNDVTISYSCFSNDNAVVVTGNNNIEADPKLVDPVAGNYRLFGRGPNAGDWSPCIDVGLNQDWMTNAVDLDGSPRIIPEGGTVDMGCYEYQPPPAGTILMGW